MAIPQWTTAELLRDGLKRTGMSQQDLFNAYRERGGRAKQPGNIGYWVRGTHEPKFADARILISILQEELTKQGKSPLPVMFYPHLWLVPDETDVMSDSTPLPKGGYRAPAILSTSVMADAG